VFGRLTWRRRRRISAHGSESGLGSESNSTERNVDVMPPGGCWTVTRVHAAAAAAAAMSTAADAVCTDESTAQSNKEQHLMARLIIV